MIDLVEDPLTGDWVSVASARQDRPLTDTSARCPFCPGPDDVSEVGGEPFQVAVFPNRYPVFDHPGAADVVVYSPNHHDDLGYLPPSHARLVWRVWAARTQALSTRSDIQAVFVFENRGRRIGATIDHPHGQIYGYPYLPPRICREMDHAGPACPLCAPEHVGVTVAASSSWRILVPHAMRMPYQIMLVPTRHAASLTGLDADERDEGSDLLQRTYRTYDRLFGFRASLALAVYQRPGAHLRLECLPVDRGSFRIKYLAASELAMGAFVTDIPVDTAAARLAAAWPEDSPA